MLFEDVLRGIAEKEGFAGKLYDEIRLVDPVSKTVLAHVKNGTGESMVCGDTCYAFFNRTAPCENCTSMLAIQRNEQIVKIDCVIPDVYIATAEPFEHEGRRYAVETLKNITDSGMLGFQGDVVVAMNKLLERRNSLLLRDTLTKIYRENFIDIRLPQNMYQVRAKERTLCLILISIKNLKEINESYGFEAGDELLQQLATALKKSVKKPEDWVARFAGSEMLAALFDLDEAKAQRTCAQIQRRLRKIMLADEAAAQKAVFTIGYHLPDGMISDTNKLVAAARKNIFHPLSGQKIHMDNALLEKSFPGLRLSEREAEAAVLLLSGKSNQEISESMYVSLPTVKKHIAKILNSSGVKTRAEFIAKALR